MKKLLEKANKYISENKKNVIQKYRHQYHLMGEVGWINDPNGFSLFQGEYHLFYQCNPYNAKWGAMHWGHAKSKDLISWEYLPIALAPVGAEGDPEGGCAFSGSALSVNGEHVLIYTENWPKRQEQSIAKSADGIFYNRLGVSPIISIDDLPKGSSFADFRDPKVWQKDDDYYLVASSRTSSGEGQLLLYKSKDLIKWQFKSVLCRNGKELGIIWECPDIFRLKDTDCLLVSAQYLPTKNDDFNNVHSAIYFLGELDYEAGKYHFSNYYEIDNGFDFYAPQTIIDSKGRRIMIAWMSMWERTRPTEELNHNWAGAMTLPRVLELADGKLLQKPLEEIKNYRKNYQYLKKTVMSALKTPLKASVSELIIEVENIDAEEFGLKLFVGDDCETIISYIVKDKLLVFNISNSGHLRKSETGREKNLSIRKTFVPLEENKLKLHIFLDNSSVEIFIQNGKKTMTSLVYPYDNSDEIDLFSFGGKATFTINKWDLGRGV